MLTKSLENNISNRLTSPLMRTRLMCSQKIGVKSAYLRSLMYKYYLVSLFDLRSGSMCINIQKVTCVNAISCLQCCHSVAPLHPFVLAASASAPTAYASMHAMVNSVINGWIKRNITLAFRCSHTKPEYLLQSRFDRASSTEQSNCTCSVSSQQAR